MRRAAIAGMVAAVLASSASVTLAEAAGWSMALPSAGYCVPAPDDTTYVARLTRALEAPLEATRPIAILDTGVDPSAPGFGGRVLQGYDALSGAPIAEDHDGHGTQAAGLAASSGAGLRGMSPSSPILPVRVYDPATRASTADGVANGIALAVQRGAGAIVLAGSGPLAGTPAADVLKVTKAIGAAFNAGVLVVAGSGDDGSQVASMPGSLPHVVTAGASTAAGARSALTATGPWLDLLVPAEGVEGPLPPGLCGFGYGFSTGTSFAAPSLGGAAAIITAQRLNLTTQQAYEVVRHAAVDIGATGRDNDSGSGVLDVMAGLTAAPPAKETTPEVDDDPFWVRGANAKAHPALLTNKKLRFKASGSVSPAKDPSDVYPVRLSKGERMVVTVTGASPSALLELSILNTRAGDFDITNAVDKNRSVATGGLSKDPQIEITASRSGLYFIAVEPADATDPDDPTLVPVDVEPYRVSAYKQRKKAKKK